MAKGAISKKKKAPSLHSRAARRATSPSINTDKSLKDVQPPPESVDHRPSVLAIHQGAGVSKKQKKSRAMSSKARKRHEKAQDRAAAIIERTEKKVALSKDKSRAIEGRRKVWEEINKNVPIGGDKVQPGGNISGNGVSVDESGSELDDEMGEMGQQGDTVNERISTRATTDTVLPQDQDEDDIS
ncbi:Alb1-domain-containing protein [Xylaria bambusicola]|uniref:Alb1-domain-containing protein n=1 Tax=Xylaria bambusicola TaxID=326684 RepID=UPI0020087874|nr:Alb1-domain-containing protein [Xylaria bambusicola]KAI0525702.1 Alb1-domain-containing protein [Xylaria bambusicola]